jgi:hypothetical protein
VQGKHAYLRTLAVVELFAAAAPRSSPRFPVFGIQVADRSSASSCVLLLPLLQPDVFFTTSTSAPSSARFLGCFFARWRA